MEYGKLIELLNEYEAKRHKTSVIAEIRKGEDRLSYLEMNWNYSELLCISKGYGFIKWLVDNDKIDIERLHKIVDYMLVMKGNYVNAHNYNSDCLIMLLAISKTPIEDLISYLK